MRDFNQDHYHNTEYHGETEPNFIFSYPRINLQILKRETTSLFYKCTMAPETGVREVDRANRSLANQESEDHSVP